MAQEVASLTKIMTCIVVIEVAERFGRNLDEEKVEIGKFETNITGTSAMLKIGEVYTVQ
jgi:D-alanyl-D-alanine carboxypeptidase